MNILRKKAIPTIRCPDQKTRSYTQIPGPGRDVCQDSTSSEAGNL